MSIADRIALLKEELRLLESYSKTTKVTKSTLKEGTKLSTVGGSSLKVVVCNDGKFGFIDEEHNLVSGINEYLVNVENPVMTAIAVYYNIGPEKDVCIHEFSKERIELALICSRTQWVKDEINKISEEMGLVEDKVSWLKESTPNVEELKDGGLLAALEADIMCCTEALSSAWEKIKIEW